MPDTLPAAFARRVAERDNPPPPPPLSQEPAAVQARIENWLLSTYKVRDKRGRLRQSLMLLALMQHPERTTGELAEAAGRGAARRPGPGPGPSGERPFDYRHPAGRRHERRPMVPQRPAAG